MSPSRLGIAPAFSTGARQAWSELASYGVEITAARITARDASNQLMTDTVIAFGGRDTIRFDLNLLVRGRSQVVKATVELVDEANRVIFAGSQSIVAQSSALSSAPQIVVVVLQYAGPGSQARSVSVVPGTALLAGKQSTTAVATATDSAARVVSDLVVSWSSSDTTLAEVAPTSAYTATILGSGKRGDVTITARTPAGVVGSTRISIAPVAYNATRVAVVQQPSASVSSGAAFSQQPVLRLVDEQGTAMPVGSVIVTAALASSSGSLLGTTAAITDTLGVARFSNLAISGAGTHQLRFTAPGLTSASSASIVVGQQTSPSLLATSGSTQATVGSVVTLVAQALDGNGDPLPGRMVSWSTDAGAPSPATSTTDANGFARTVWRLGTSTGTQIAEATAAGIGTATFAVQVTSASTGGTGGAGSTVPVTAAIFGGGSQSAQVATKVAVEPSVIVRDGSGRPVPGVTVAFAVVSGGGAIIGPAAVTTDASGVARIGGWSLGTRAGANSLTATATGISTSVTFSATATAGQAAKLNKIGWTTPTAGTGTTLAAPLVVEVLDAYDNPIAGKTVSFVTSSGTVSPSTAVTDAAGRASTQWTLGSTSGTQVVVASISTPGLSTSFQATATATPTRIQFLYNREEAAKVGEDLKDIFVLVTDAGGNGLQGVQVTFSASGRGDRIDAESVTNDKGLVKVRHWYVSQDPGTDVLHATVVGTSLSANLVINVKK